MDDVMQFPKFPAGFLAVGVFCVRCGRQTATVSQTDCRQYRVNDRGGSWQRFAMNLCRPCLVEFLEQAIK